MDHSTITALAKSLVPFVAEAVAPLAARIAELEARPIEKGDAGERGADGSIGPPGPKGDSGELAMVPPEIAEQIKSAIHLLHESPVLAQAGIAAPRPPAKVTRIERDDDGNFVPIYDETQP